MGAIAVLIPVLDRPQRVAPLIESLERSSYAIECVPYFICSPGDDAEIEEVGRHRAHAIILPRQPAQGDYARKINTGFRVTKEPFVFLGADDLLFHPGWAERAVARWYSTGACVVGTNDLGNSRVTSGRHSTHTLVHRAYGECGTIDGEQLLHEGYWHNYVDDEFIQTAQARETYSHATDAIVEHLHPSWGKAKDDATYQLGNARFHEDRRYFERRTKLWHAA